MNFLGAVKKAVNYSKKSHGIVTSHDIRSYCSYRGVKIKDSLVDEGLKILIDGVKQEEVCAFNVIKGSSIIYKKDGAGEYVLLESHIGAIPDTVETVGHLQVYVGDELVVEVKG